MTRYCREELTSGNTVRNCCNSASKTTSRMFAAITVRLIEARTAGHGDVSSKLRNQALLILGLAFDPLPRELSRKHVQRKGRL